MLEQIINQTWSMLRNIHMDFYAVKVLWGTLTAGYRWNLGRWIDLGLKTNQRLRFMDYMVPPIRTAKLPGANGKYIYFALGTLQKQLTKDPGDGSLASYYTIDYFDRLVAPVLLTTKVPQSIGHTEYTNLYINEIEVDLTDTISGSVNTIEYAYLLPYWKQDLNTLGTPDYPIGTITSYFTTANIFYDSDLSKAEQGGDSVVKKVHTPYSRYKRPFGVDILPPATLRLYTQGLPVQVNVLYRAMALQYKHTPYKHEITPDK